MLLLWCFLNRVVMSLLGLYAIAAFVVFLLPLLYCSVRFCPIRNSFLKAQLSLTFWTQTVFWLVERVRLKVRRPWAPSAGFMSTGLTRPKWFSPTRGLLNSQSWCVDNDRKSDLAHIWRHGGTIFCLLFIGMCLLCNMWLCTSCFYVQAVENKIVIYLPLCSTSYEEKISLFSSCSIGCTWLKEPHIGRISDLHTFSSSESSARRH